MKTPEARPRFQSSNRHYHRYREDNRGWDDWVDPAAQRGSWKRWLWISTSVVLAGAGVALLFYFDIL
ncbi:hypothetical protein [Luteolibacter soli]|uniref:Uncharacterized protein n=1 Tax=Luteolibacter soli TaxID=3135280 RepID=A0ABU9B0F6_9BACT